MRPVIKQFSNIRICRLTCVFVAVVLLSGSRLAAAQTYMKADAPVEARAQDLLSRMTMEEKFWQLFMLSTKLDGDIQKYSHGAFGFQIS